MQPSKDIWVGVRIMIVKIAVGPHIKFALDFCLQWKWGVPKYMYRDNLFPVDSDTVLLHMYSLTCSTWGVCSREL